MSEPLESSSAPLQPTDVAREPTVGERLFRAREARGLSIDEVAAALKLGPRQVVALEAGEWQGLPGNTFIRGFVRNYARYLELEIEPLMAALDVVLKQPADTLKVGNAHPAEMPAHGSNALFHKSRRLVISLAGIAVVVALVAVIALVAGNASSLASLGGDWLAKVGGQKAGEPVATAENTAPGTPAQEPVLPPGATPQQVLRPQALVPAEVSPNSPVSASPSLRIVLGVESLVEISDADGRVLFFQGQVPAGSAQTFPVAGPVTVVLGHAAGARIFWKGQEVDLASHRKGDGARLVLE